MRGQASNLLRTADIANPLAFFVNGIGDILLSLPSIRALANLFAPRLTLICAAGAHRMFYSDLMLANVVELQVRKNTGSPEFDVRGVMQRVKSCDLFLSLTPWHSASVDRLLAELNPKLSVGYFPNFDVCLERDYGKHSTELAFDITRWVEPKVSVETFAYPPTLPVEDRQIADDILSHLPRGSKILVAHCDTSPEKMWPAERFVEVFTEFLTKHLEFVVIIVGSRPQPVDRGIHADRIIPTYGIPIEVAFCLVAAANLFLGVDSCMLHVADLFRVPGVGLFGPTSSDEFGFRFARHCHLQRNECLSAIGVGEVLSALEALLNANSAGRGYDV